MALFQKFTKIGEYLPTNLSIKSTSHVGKYRLYGYRPRWQDETQDEGAWSATLTLPLLVMPLLLLSMSMRLQRSLGLRSKNAKATGSRQKLLKKITI